MWSRYTQSICMHACAQFVLSIAKEPKSLLAEDQNIVTKVKELESAADHPSVGTNLVYR